MNELWQVCSMKRQWNRDDGFRVYRNTRGGFLDHWAFTPIDPEGHTLTKRHAPHPPHPREFGTAQEAMDWVDLQFPIGGG